MSKSRNFKFRVILAYISFTTKKRAFARFAWDTKEFGKPTLENLKKFREGMNNSITDKNGANTHLCGSQSNYGTAWIETNVKATQRPERIATFTPPMFEEI